MVVTLVLTVSALPAVEPREPDLGTTPLPSICSDHLTNNAMRSAWPELIEQRNARGHEHGGVLDADMYKPIEWAGLVKEGGACACGHMLASACGLITTHGMGILTMEKNNMKLSN